jgi:hypothetical protein
VHILISFRNNNIAAKAQCSEWKIKQRKKKLENRIKKKKKVKRSNILLWGPAKPFFFFVCFNQYIPDPVPKP